MAPRRPSPAPRSIVELPTIRLLVQADELLALELPAGSMGPKVEAAAGFAQATGSRAIGSLAEAAVLAGRSGTTVVLAPAGIRR